MYRPREAAKLCEKDLACAGFTFKGTPLNIGMAKELICSTLCCSKLRAYSLDIVMLEIRSLFFGHIYVQNKILNCNYDKTSRVRYQFFRY
jgi:hypothetical protein